MTGSLIILRGDAAQRSFAAESDRKLEEKLTVIEKSISSLQNGSVQSGNASSKDAEQYKKVTAAVSSMKQNLDSFRQGSSNTNEELSQSLDSVIQGLDTLQKEMKEAGKKSAAEADKAAREEERTRRRGKKKTAERRWSREPWRLKKSLTGRQKTSEIRSGLFLQKRRTVKAGKWKN